MNTSTALVSRRLFLQSATLLAGGFAIGVWHPANAARMVGAAATTPAQGEVGLSAWVRVKADNTVTVVVSQAELGQGISTTLPAVLVDELGADWAQVQTETAPFDPVYANPRYQWMFTGNSESIQSFHDLMRTIGASARTVLIGAASNLWGVPAEELSAQQGFVVHAISARRASFGELALAASRIAPPEKPVLKANSELKLIGRSLPRVDVPAKVDGSAVFGIDFKLPGMLNATVRTAPQVGARLELLNSDILRQQLGVVAVLPVTGGFAVVADTFWHARSAMLKAVTRTIRGSGTGVNSLALRAAYLERLNTGPFATPVEEGAAAELIKASGKTFKQDYESPFLAHATMEPMNCVAHVTATHCTVWAPTQGQNLAWFALQQALGFKGEQVEVNRTPYMGGGFGRRLLPDFAVQAALVSREVNAPVKIIWDREEDLRRDSYRPASAMRLEAALGADGLPTAIAARLVSPTIITAVAPFLAESIQKSRVDPSAMEGMTEWPYAIEHRQVQFHLMEIAVPTSVLRTTGFGPNNFARESFIDELAHTVRQDPYEYRRRLLRGNVSALRVLERAAQLSEWNRRLPSGEGRGLAFASAFGTLLAQVIHVRVKGSDVKVLHVFSVADPGRVLDPMIGSAVVEGGVVFGLAGCKSEVTFTDGAIDQNNFDALKLPYLAECPLLTTELVEGGGPLGGLAEVGPVTVAAALANAIFSATGKRLRAMPLSRNGLQFV